jgi:hypothetical protein
MLNYNAYDAHRRLFQAMGEAHAEGNSWFMVLMAVILAGNFDNGN